jgi:hypothetical protein
MDSRLLGRTWASVFHDAPEGNLLSGPEADIFMGETDIVMEQK